MRNVRLMYTEERYRSGVVLFFRAATFLLSFAVYNLLVPITTLNHDMQAVNHPNDGSLNRFRPYNIRLHQLLTKKCIFCNRTSISNIEIGLSRGPQAHCELAEHISDRPLGDKPIGQYRGSYSGRKLVTVGSKAVSLELATRSSAVRSEYWSKAIY